MRSERPSCDTLRAPGALREPLESRDELVAGQAPQRRADLRAGLENHRVEVERRVRTLQGCPVGARVLQDSLDKAPSGG